MQNEKLDQKKLLEQGIAYSHAVNFVYARCQVRGIVPAGMKAPQTSSLKIEEKDLTKHLFEIVNALSINLLTLLDFIDPNDRAVFEEVNRILSNRYLDNQPLPMDTAAA